MAACWALKEKYWLWSLKIPLEAQSDLQFRHIVKKHMQQIRTYCSSGGVIRGFEPWAPLLSSCPLDDKLTLLSYSYYPSQCLSWKAFSNKASLFIRLPSQIPQRMSTEVKVSVLRWDRQMSTIGQKTFTNVCSRTAYILIKYCHAKVDRWESWVVTGAEEVTAGGNGTDNLTVAVTQEEGGDVWHAGSRAVENSGPD